ncbi:hypothetical protein ACLOJK_029317 [Asimina triloba]
MLLGAADPIVHAVVGRMSDLELDGARWMVAIAQIWIIGGSNGFFLDLLGCHGDRRCCLLLFVGEDLPQSTLLLPSDLGVLLMGLEFLLPGCGP